MRKILMIAAILLSASSAADTNPYALGASIYKVEVPSDNGTRVFSGTGVLIAYDKILTNCHVVKDKGGWPYVIQRTTGRRFNVTQFYNLGGYDACVLVGIFPGTPIPLTDSINSGEPVWVYGYPRNMEVVSQGTLKSLVKVDSETAIESAVFCDKGSSGGPLLNAKGQLAGLNYKVFQYRNSCLSIPAFMLMPYLNR